MIFSQIIAFDLETTGLNPKSAEIIELGAAIRHPSGDISTWSALIKPKGKIPPLITALTGIKSSTFMEDGSLTLQEAMGIFKNIISDKNALLAAHNGAAFDNKFLKIAGVNIPEKRYWDTLLQMRADLKNDRSGSWRDKQKRAVSYRTKQSVKLEEAAKYYKIKQNSEEAHRAEADALTCLQIALKQIKSQKIRFCKQA